MINWNAMKNEKIVTFSNLKQNYEFQISDLMYLSHKGYTIHNFHSAEYK